ncbi:MAG TPA: universal stress protein [Anaerolineales bacterium]|nr:universal stress protein [Anaerolineales bacterium]
MRWLISTDGTERSQRAAEFASKFLRPEKDQAILLGVVSNGNPEDVEESLEFIHQLLKGLVVRRTMREEEITTAIELEAQSEHVEMAVYGSRGRHGITSLLLGSVAARLAHDRPCSVMVVRDQPQPVKRILVGISLSPRRSATIEMAGKLAQAVGAEVAVLHVMSQLALTDKASTGPLNMTAEEAIAHGTTEGEILVETVQFLEKMGVHAVPIIRHGLVMDETLEEIETGNYGLVVIGAHAALQNIPWSAWLMEDVAKDILMNTRCPLVIV